MTSQRLVVFVPYQQAEATDPFAVQFTRHLGAAEVGDYEILARREDAAGGVLPWANERLTVLPEQDQRPKKGLLPLASQEDLQTLLVGPRAAHDVLFVPQPYRTLPVGAVLGCAAPIVVRVSSFAHDDGEYGAFGDITRRDIAYVLSVAQLVVFPTEELRRHAVERYGVAESKTRVVTEAVSPPVVPSRLEAIRAKYGLPEHYLVCENGRDPQLRAIETLEALALVEGRGGERISLVSLGPNIDPVYNEDWLGEELSEASRAFWHELPAVSAEDCYAIVSHAVGLLGKSAGLTGPSTVDLMASSVGLPRLVSSDSALAGSFDLTERIMRCNEIPRDPPSSRSMADVVQDYRTLFAEAAGTWLNPGACVHRRVLGPKPREQRVAWLINHTTLHDSEVPLMRRLGLEIYTSKKVPDTDFRSGSSDFSDDAESTLPVWALEILNSHDFYQQPFTPAIAEILNTYFSAVICPAWPTPNYQLMRDYKGRILTRVFGREHPADYCGHLGGKDPDRFYRLVCQHHHRYWLACCYDEIATHESPLLRRGALTLPVGIPDYTWRQEGTWTGSDPRLLFVCPSIKSSAFYYGLIYEQFKKVFGDVPHWIAGDQPEAVADPCVSGFVSEQLFTTWMRNFRVMYYHSREPRHIHYHPLEAIIFGMPVVFLRGGLMETFGGPDQPGACDTEEEARDKVLRLLRGDTDLADRIRAAQGKILGPFLEGYNERLWRDRLLGQVLSTPTHAGERPPSASFVPLNGESPALPSVAGGCVPVTPLLPPSPARQEYETLRGWLGLPSHGASSLSPGSTTGAGPAVIPLNEGGRVGRAKRGPPALHRYSPSEGRRPALVGLASLDPPYLLRSMVLGQAELPFLLGGLENTPEDGPEEIPEADSVRPANPHRWASVARQLGRGASSLVDCGLIPFLYLRGAVTQLSLLPKHTGITQRMPRWVRSLPGIRHLAARNYILPVGVPEKNWWQTELEAPPPTHPPAIVPPRRSISPSVDPVGVLVYAPEILSSPDVSRQSLLFVGHGMPHDEQGYFGEDAPALVTHWQHLAAAGVASVHPSEWSRGEAIRRHGFDPHRSYVLPLVPLPVEPIGPDEVLLISRRFGLEQGSYWVHVGNFDPEENLITLCRVLEQQKLRGDPVLPLVLLGHQAQVRQPAGIAAYHDALRRAAKRAGLRHGENLHVLPDLTPREHSALIAGAAACLAPGLTSGQVPLPAMEAMCHRVPTLIGRTPGVEGHLGQDAEWFLILPPQEPGAWVRAMHAVTHHAPEVAEAVRVGFDWVRAQQKAFPRLWGQLIAGVEPSHVACRERVA